MGKCFCAGVSIGALLVLIGSLSVGIVPWLVDKLVREGVKMETPSSGMYDSFKNSSAKGVEVYKTVQMFSVTNAWDVEHYGAKPNVVQVGPYTYREFETYPENVTVWQPNATFQYRSFTKYVFQPQMSTTDEIITVPRLALFAFAKKLTWVNRTGFVYDVLGHKLNYSIPYDQGLIDLFLSVAVDVSNSTVFKNISARTLIETGYADPLADKLADLFGQNRSNIVLNPDTTWPIFDATGNNEAYTGGEASSTQPAVPENSYRRMTMFHGMTSMPDYWVGEEANRVDGTDATAFHPFVTKGEALRVWVNSLVRKVWLTFQKDVTTKGIACYRHVIDPAELTAANNAQYHMTKDGWLPSPSQITDPINYTKPYFLDADTSFLNTTGDALTLLASTAREDIDTYLDIEPLTGTLVQVHKRLQVNVPFGPFEWDTWSMTAAGKQQINTSVWAQTANLTRTFVPLVWQDQHMVLPDSIVSDIKNGILLPLLLAKVLGGLAIAIGGVLIIAAIIVRVLAIRREERNCNQHEFYHLNPNGV